MPGFKRLKLTPCSGHAKLGVFADQIKRRIKTLPIARRQHWQTAPFPRSCGQNQHGTTGNQLVAHAVKHGYIDERVGSCCHICLTILTCLTDFFNKTFVEATSTFADASRIRAFLSSLVNM